MTEAAPRPSVGSARVADCGQMDDAEGEQSLQRAVHAAYQHPDARTEDDIEAIMSVMQELPLMLHNTVETRRDLCHAVRLGSFEDGEIISTPACLNGEGSLFLVISGQLEVKAPDNLPFGSMLWRSQQDDNSKGSATPRHMSRVSMATPMPGSPPPRTNTLLTHLSAQELRSVFSSLDQDNKGRLSVNQVQTVLESFGIPSDCEKTKEMILAVDADSGEAIDFDTFKTVIQQMFEANQLQTELNPGTGSWQQDGDEGYTRLYSAGGSFGENSIIYGMPLVAEMKAVGKTQVLRLDSRDYTNILEGGGINGDLGAKMEAMHNNTTFRKYAHRTDKKALAQAMKFESVRVQSKLYKQGAPADSLYIIVSGQANVVSTSEGGDQEGGDRSSSPMRPGRSAGSNLRKSKPTKTEIAIVGVGDICGEAVLLDQPAHTTSVVASTGLEVLALRKKDAIRILTDKDFKDLQEFVREREEARTARLQAAQESMQSTHATISLTGHKARNEEALVDDLTRSYGSPSRFLPGSEAPYETQTALPDMADTGSPGTSKHSPWWDPTVLLPQSSQEVETPPAPLGDPLPMPPPSLPEGSSELIESMRHLRPAGLRSLAGSTATEEVYRVLQLEAVDQGDQAVPPLPLQIPSKLTLDGHSPSPTPPWFRADSSRSPATRESPPLRQRSQGTSPKKPLEHRASQSVSMGQSSDWWIEASIRRNMNLGTSVFTGIGEEEDLFVEFVTSRRERAKAAETRRQPFVSGDVPLGSLPPELLVVDTKTSNPIPVNKLKPHVLLKSRTGGEKLYTPSAMRAAPLSVPPLVHSPFHAGPRVSPGASPTSSRASSPRSFSPPRFSPVPAERYTSPARSGDASPARSISPEGMLANITRSHKEQRSRHGSPVSSPGRMRSSSPGRLLSDEERRALGSREKHDYLKDLRKMLNSLPREVGASFPVVPVTEKEPRLPYTYNFIRKQKARSEVLTRRGWSPPAAAVRGRAALQEESKEQGKQDVAELQQRKLMLELLMDRNEADRVRYFKLQRDVNSLQTQIMNARAHNQAAAGARSTAKWTTAGARRLAMKKKR